jgi:hypothetical protein
LDESLNNSGYSRKIGRSVLKLNMGTKLSKKTAAFVIAALAKMDRSIKLPRFLTSSRTTSLLDGSFAPSLNFKVNSKAAPAYDFHIEGRSSSYKISHFFPERFHIQIDSCFLDAKNSILYDLKGSIIEESTPWSKDHLVATSIPNPVIASKFISNYGSEKSIVLSTNGYYHWLIEDLPTYLLTKTFEPDSRTIVAKVKPKYVENFLNSENIEFTEIDRFARVNNINFISRGNDTGWPHPKDIEILRQNFFDHIKETEKNKKIYISREKSTRSPRFEAKLAGELKQRGWVILYLEDLEFFEQIREISGASVVCGVHGAGLSNMLWMKPGTQVIEIGGSEFRTCFRNLAKVANLKYSRLDYDVDSHIFDLQRIINCISS